MITTDDMSPLYLTRGPKYRLERTFTARVPIRMAKYAMSDCGLVSLSPGGFLIVKPGWSWDGASGPMPDFPSTHRGAFIHDALSQLIRQKKIPLFHKTSADEILRDVMHLDGLWGWLARRCFNAVQAFGMGSMVKTRKVYVYPKGERK